MEFVKQAHREYVAGVPKKHADGGIKATMEVSGLECSVHVKEDHFIVKVYFDGEGSWLLWEIKVDENYEPVWQKQYMENGELEDQRSYK